MQPTLHKLPLSPDNSFLYKRWECEYFDKPWHFHEEYELVLIDQTEGTRFVGDNISHFKDGDLVFLGPNIPHFYRNNESYYKKIGLIAKSIFIHFTEASLGEHFFDLPEMKLVRNLLMSSSLGIEVYGDTNKYIQQELFNMEYESPPRRLLSLLDILISLSISKELKSIMHQRFTACISKDTDKINTVLQFIMANFTKEIYLDEIASKFSMSTSAFSRYFKHHTRKTFSDFLAEVRISSACKLLIEDNYNISEIGYLCGFDNLSNFYRHFKKYVHLMPKNYKKNYQINRNKTCGFT